MMGTPARQLRPEGHCSVVIADITGDATLTEPVKAMLIGLTVWLCLWVGGRCY